MEVKRCSQAHLINFLSFHLTPITLLTNFPHYPIIAGKIPFSLHFHPFPLVSHIFLVIYPPKVISQPKTPFP